MVKSAAISGRGGRMGKKKSHLSGKGGRRAKPRRKGHVESSVVAVGKGRGNLQNGKKKKAVFRGKNGKNHKHLTGETLPFPLEKGRGVEQGEDDLAKEVGLKKHRDILFRTWGPFYLSGGRKGEEKEESTFRKERNFLQVALFSRGKTSPIILQKKGRLEKGGGAAFYLIGGKILGRANKPQ